MDFFKQKYPKNMKNSYFKLINILHMKMFCLLSEIIFLENNFFLIYFLLHSAFERNLILVC